MNTPPLFAPANSQQFIFQTAGGNNTSGGNTNTSSTNNTKVDQQQQQQQQQQQLYPDLADLFTDYFLHEYDETGGLTAYNAMLVAAAAAQQQQQQQQQEQQQNRQQNQQQQQQFLLPTGRGIMTPFHTLVSPSSNNNTNNNYATTTNNNTTNNNALNAISNTPFVRPTVPAATAHKFAVAAAVAAAQQQQQQQQQQRLPQDAPSFTTTTANAIPSMIEQQQQQQQSYVAAHHIAKKHKGGITLSNNDNNNNNNQLINEIFGSQQLQQQMGIMDSLSSYSTFLQQQQQQQQQQPTTALYNLANTNIANPAVVAMSSLSSRLGLTLTEQGQVICSNNRPPQTTAIPPTSTTNTTNTTSGPNTSTTNNVPFSMPFHRMISKEEQDSAAATVAAATVASLQPTKINLPVGHGIRLGSTTTAITTALTEEQQQQPQQQQKQNGVIPNNNNNTQHTQPPLLYDMSQLSTGLTPKEVEDRRLRNREHAKRSRVRKKFLLEALQQDVKELQSENQRLRLYIQQHLPEQSLQIITDCCGPDTDIINTSNSDSPVDTTNTESVTPLTKPDLVLVQTLTRSQQNFILTDPTLPDNPIVFASNGFLELTGYTRDEVSGVLGYWRHSFYYKIRNITCSMYRMKLPNSLFFRHSL